MTKERKIAHEPEDLARLFVDRANAGDAEGLSLLYEPDAVLAFPPGQTTVGRDAILHVFEQLLARAPHFEVEAALPTVSFEDLALTSTCPADGTGGELRLRDASPMEPGCG